MDNLTLHLDIISPEKKLFSGDVSSVVFPGISGSFGILPGHAPVVSPLKKGVIAYKIGAEILELEIDGGIVEVSGGVVSACVERSVRK
jgi:F-type H+-transporting ATPase subunit epsilon